MPTAPAVESVTPPVALTSLPAWQQVLLLDRPAAVRVTNQSILLGLLLGLLASAAGLLWVDELMALLRLRGDAAGFAADYLRPLFSVLPIQMLGAAGIACLVGAGDTRMGLF